MSRRRTGPGPEYDGPAYDPVYGPAFDSSLGDPVTPPMLRRTAPPNPRRTQILVVAAALAVLIVAATVVLAIRFTGDDETAAPAGPAADVPRGQSAQLVETLTANGFRCAEQFTTADGTRRGCFATRADTVLTAAVFEDDSSGTVTAVRLESRELSGSAVLRPRTLAAADELVRVFGPVVFPADRDRAQAGLRRRSLTIDGDWGRFAMADTGGLVELRADRTGRKPLTSEPSAVLVSGPGETLTRAGWRCGTTCTKTSRGVDAEIRWQGTTSVALTVAGTTGFDALVAELLAVVPDELAVDLRTWLADQRERGAGSGYVRGRRVWFETRPTGSALRLASQPTLSPVS